MKKAKKESETISKNCLHKTSALISLNLKISTKSTIIRITDTTFLSKKKIKKTILIYSLTNPQTFSFFYKKFLIYKIKKSLPFFILQHFTQTHTQTINIEK
jgi:hypothetical protein